MATTSIFMTAAEARQNPLRDAAIHAEARAIETAVLKAVRNGFYQVTIAGGTPMTDGSAVNVAAAGVDLASDQITLPAHPFKDGDIVTVSSSGTLPSPLDTTAHYHVIYVDADHIKLAASSSDASDPVPISLDFSVGVVEIAVTDGGAGYLNEPNLQITPPANGTTATARAYLSPHGSIDSIPVLSPGQGFTAEPQVVIAPPGSGATAGDWRYKVVGISVASGGANYRAGDVLSVLGGSGTTATATVIAVTPSGAVTHVALGNPGVYATLPSLSGTATAVGPTGGTGCTLNLTMGISSVAVISGGFGYTTPPAVRIGGGAKAVASISAGVVVAITITDGGSGYTSAPSIEIDGGSGASARAVLQPTGVRSYVVLAPGVGTYVDLPVVSVVAQGAGATIGSVHMRAVSANLTNSGRGYSVGDTLLIAGGAGTANASILVTKVGNFGEILAYSLVTGGSYSVLPVLRNNSVLGGTGSAATFTISMGLLEITVADPGADYASPPVVKVISTPADGQGATALTVLDGDGVGSITVTAPGSGYTAIPNIEITAGSGAAAVAVLEPTGVDTITVVSGGSGWSSAAVRIAGDGQGATAEVTITAGEITDIVVTAPGSGYTRPPQVTITGDGFGAAATAQLIPSNLAAVVPTAQGEDYTSPPTVSVGDAQVRADLAPTGVSRIVVTDGGDSWSGAPVIHVVPSADQVGPVTAPATTSVIARSVDHIVVTDPGSGYAAAPQVTLSAPTGAGGVTATAAASIGSGTGTLVVSLYPNSRDYFKVWKNQAPSDPLYARPYAERMDTIIAYFTSLGYSINRQTNPQTGNSLQWTLMW